MSNSPEITTVVNPIANIPVMLDCLIIAKKFFVLKKADLNPI